MHHGQNARGDVRVGRVLGAVLQLLVVVVELEAVPLALDVEAAVVVLAVRVVLFGEVVEVADGAKDVVSGNAATVADISPAHPRT